MRTADSAAALEANAQHEPHKNWFFTDVTLSAAAQSTAVGAAARRRRPLARVKPSVGGRALSGALRMSTAALNSAGDCEENWLGLAKKALPEPALLTAAMRSRLDLKLA